MSHCEATLPSLERAASAARRRDDTDAAASATALWTAQRRSYRDLLRHKRESFWMAKVDAERSSPHQLWRSVDAVGPRPRPESQDIGAMAFHRFFEAKVAGVSASTADAPPPSFTPAPLQAVNFVCSDQLLPPTPSASQLCWISNVPAIHSRCAY